MADVGASAPKKSRYVRSKIPILSKDYKATLKNVKDKKIAIEKKEAEIKLLMKEKADLCVNMESMSLNSNVAIFSSQESKELVKDVTYTKSEVRSVIRTPGGTKRKVRPSHVQFKNTLSSFLRENVRESSKELKIDELLERLRSCQATRAMDKTNLLKQVSSILEKKLCFSGKKREAYYKGLELIPLSAGAGDAGDQLKTHFEGSDNDAPRTSPASKIPRANLGSVRTKEAAVRTRLAFEEPSTSSKTILEDSNFCSLDSPTPWPGTSLMGQDVKIREQFKELYKMLLKAHSMATMGFEDELEECELANEQLLALLNSTEQSLNQYIDVTSQIISNQQEIITMYKDITETGKLFGGLLSLSEKKQIRDEVAKTRNIFNLGIRQSGEVVDLAEILDPGIFQTLLDKLRVDCPTIMHILEQLVLSPNASRNSNKTELVKLKASVHLLASLMDVRDQTAKNDIPLLFGLLCLCYGAGPRMIELMQHLGLSESHRVLCNVLNNQLVHYKELIKRRSAFDIPVITYQDNMQLMRTSMRHLRLSKLQKEKLKQGKMWDFTVRGWRLADITGIEELFMESATATEPQKDITTIKYEDTKIESNPDHLERFQDFQDRNILRKLDIGLNQVPLTANELKDAGIDKLKEISEKETTKLKYIIKVPEQPHEFPHLSTSTTKIYPLPISHENQCKTLGLGRNLDLFSEEFGFESRKAPKFLPLKKSAKEFDLELGYTRFAFLKAMDRHKEQQKILETTLRGDALDEEEGLILMDSGSDNDSEDDIE